MDAMNLTTPAGGPGPLAGPRTRADAASAPARSGFTLRGRTWVYGATLVAAGVLGGSGVTYAVVADSPVPVRSVQQDGSVGTR